MECKWKWHCGIVCDAPEFCESHEEGVYTNADYIRGMTDEELAEILYDIDARVGNTLLNGWFEWLQQPYKEDDNG